MARVELQAASKHYGKQTALHDLYLAVEDGELVGVVGAEGAGKTVLLRLIAGLERLSHGQILIGDREVTKLRAGLRNCALVSANAALLPQLSVRENLAYGLLLRGTPRKAALSQAAAMARSLGLGDRLATRPRQLSASERQRVALGRAMLRQAAVCLLDAPFAALAASERPGQLRLLKQLRQAQPGTLLYAAGEQAEAMALADRVAVLHRGKVAQIAPPLELYERPANVLVAGLIGAPAMNLLPARLVGHDDGLALRLADGSELPLPPAQAERLAPAKDAQVTFGIRPEHVSTGGDGAATLRFAPRALDTEAGQRLLRGRIGDQPFAASAGADCARLPDQPCQLACDMAKAHLFDPSSGRAL